MSSTTHHRIAMLIDADNPPAAKIDFIISVRIKKERKSTGEQ